MEANYKAVVLVLFCGLGTVFGETCNTGTFIYRQYCPEACCGTSPNQYCCSYDDVVDMGGRIGAIVGGVIGGIILLSIIGCIICCACQKSQRRPGHVVQPMGGTTVVMSNQQGYGMAPQPYQHGQPAPAYGSNPAYPPPYPGNSNNAPPPPPQY